MDSEIKLVTDLFKSDDQARRKHEMRWYLADNFYENNHFVKSMNQLGKLEPVKFPRGIQIRPIPRAKKQLNSIVNLVVYNNPRWVIYPRVEFADDAERQKYEDNTKRIGQWFDDLWYFLNLKNQIRKLVFYGFKYNVGYAEIGGDNEGNIFVDSYEPYEIWHDAGISDLKEATHLIKGVSRTLQYVKETKDKDDEEFLYDPEVTKDLKVENRLAISEWKNIRLQEQNKGTANTIEDERVGRVFIKECWIKNGKTWDLITECQGKKLRSVKTDFEELPWIMYKPQEGLIHQSSPFEDLIPMNKAIDILTALIEGYTRTTAIGRYAKHKMSKVERILNEHGEMIEYEGTQPPTQMAVAPLPGSAIDTLQMYINFMDEIGTSVVSFGKVPQGVKSYKALESMKNSEFSNLQTSIDLLAKTLEEMAEKIMDFADKYFNEPVPVYHLDNGKPDYFKLVSSSNSVASENPESDAIPVGSKYKVKVEIESGMAYTEEGKRDSYMQLAEKGYLPKEEVLKAFKFSNVGDIIDKLQEEKNKQTSIVQSAEFNSLPPETKLKILADLGVNVDQDIRAKVPLSGILGG